METPARCCVREDVLLEHQNACCAMGCAKVDAGAFSAEEEAEDSSTLILYINLQFALFFWGVPSLLHHLPRARQANCPATAAHGAHTVCAFRQRSTAYSCHSVLEDADSQHINYLCHSKIAGLSTPIFSTQCIVYGFGRAIVLSSATPPAARSVLRPRPHPLSSRHGGRATSFLIYIYTICPLHFSANALFNTQVINDAAPLSPADHGSYAQHPPMMWARLPGCCFGCGVSAFVGGGVYTAYCVAAKI